MIYAEDTQFSTELAVSIPIFHSDISTDMKYELAYVDRMRTYAEDAIVCALHLINNTDFVENRVAIYFHIEDTVYDIVMPVFRKHRIVSSFFIRKIAIPEALANDALVHVQYGKKLMCFKDDDIQTKKWLICDTDLCLHRTTKIACYEKLINCEFACAHLFDSEYTTPTHYQKHWVWGTVVGVGIPFDWDADMYQQELAAFKKMGFDRQTDETYPKQLPYVATQMLLVDKAHPIYAFLRENFHISYQDEYLINMWCVTYQQVPVGLDNLLNLHYLWKPDVYENRAPTAFDDGAMIHRTEHEVEDNMKYVNIEKLLEHTNSDKTGWHNYGQFYTMLINSLALKFQRPLKICEIGTSFFGEGALAAFQVAENIDSVVAIDLIQYSGELNEKTIFYQRDAYTVETLQFLEKEGWVFDLIIDDGSHHTHHQEFFMTSYHALLNEGGMLVCEDVWDKNFFNKMAKHPDIHGIDGWTHRVDDVNTQHDNRLLIKEKKSLHDKLPSKPPKVKGMQLTFHALMPAYAIPGLVSCAFTQKVVKFAKMMRKLGHRVFVYGHEAFEGHVSCDELIPCTNDAVLQKVYGTARYDAVPDAYHIYDFANQTFNFNAEEALKQRVQTNDFLLPFYGWGHQTLCAVMKQYPILIVEPGIGYPDTFEKYRIFESASKYHHERGKEDATVTIRENFPDSEPVKKNWRWWHRLKHTDADWESCVIPNYFDPDDFEYREKKLDQFLFLGRIGEHKGIHIALSLARDFNTKMIVAGPGDLYALGYEIPPTVEFIGVVDKKLRKRLIAESKAVICPSLYLEPFLGVHVEAGFGGTPIITTNWGATMDFCKQGITGFKCQNYHEFKLAVKNLHTVTPADCREHAMWFCLDNVSLMYHHYFHSLLNTVKNGFWADNPYIEDLEWLSETYDEAAVQQKIKDIYNRIQEERTQ